jgi:hypothetical protein
MPLILRLKKKITPTIGKIPTPESGRLEHSHEIHSAAMLVYIIIEDICIIAEIYL